MGRVVALGQRLPAHGARAEQQPLQLPVLGLAQPQARGMGQLQAVSGPASPSRMTSPTWGCPMPRAANGDDPGGLDLC